MNKKNILRLASHIENLKHVNSLIWDKFSYEEPEYDKFTMSYYAANCGTPCCIAGHAAELMLHDRYGKDASLKLVNVPALAYEFFGEVFIDDKLYRLFVPQLNLEAITPEVAARVLRHLAETGEIKWPVQNFDSINFSHEFPENYTA